VSVVAATGFSASGVVAGIKPDGAPDFALVVGPEGTQGAAVFTTNRAPAAPVVVSRQHVAAGPAVRGVVVNSGCANAGTGGPGEAVALATAADIAIALGCDVDEVIVCSTGPIGTRLDEAAVSRGIKLAVQDLGAGEAAGRAAAVAIMTTDSVPKEAVVAGDGFVIGGMAKGAGMIRPDMATMLAVLTTDAVVDPATLGSTLRQAVDTSFNSLNIDGCQSTNDTVVLLSSSRSGTIVEESELLHAAEAVCRDLAAQIAADAEGATRVVHIIVQGAKDAAEARLLGKVVADSVLVRASFYGGDPNWGRILAALGAAPIEVDPELVAVAYEDVEVSRRGVTVDCEGEELAHKLATGDFSVTIAVGSGPGSAEILTTDLTPEYVRFNGLRT